MESIGPNVEWCWVSLRGPGCAHVSLMYPASFFCGKAVFIERPTKRLVRQVYDTQVQGPGFNPQIPYGLGMAVRACKLSTGKAQIDWTLGLTGQPV